MKYVVALRMLDREFLEDVGLPYEDVHWSESFDYYSAAEKCYREQIEHCSDNMYVVLASYNFYSGEIDEPNTWKQVILSNHSEQREKYLSSCEKSNIN